MPSTTLTLTTQPLTTRPFVGLGVQADGVLYHEACIQEHQLTPADLARFELRLQQLRPSITRTFVDVRWFNPALDGQTFDWSTPEYAHLRRLLRLVEKLGAQQNLVCFQPQDVPAAQLPRLLDAMAGLVAHLRAVEGLTSVRWVTLFNEPDSFVPHESPLYRRIFGDRLDTANKTWPDYVAACHYAVQLFSARGLAPALRLTTPDCVWGHPMRRERMELAARDFAQLDVDYAYHNYSPEWPGFYDGNPDFAHPGMGAEARLFRGLVGADKQLVCWEFNGAGHGFGHAWPGVGRYGEDLLGAVAHGANITDQIFTALNHGTDGLCLWCLADGPYWPWVREPSMQFGLYRWRSQGWVPKPYWYYFSALCQHLRPPHQRLRLTGLPDDGPVNALALGLDQHYTLAVVNKTHAAHTVKLQFPRGVTQASVLRVYPGAFPTPEGVPLTQTVPLTLTSTRRATLALAPLELAIVQAG